MSITGTYHETSTESILKEEDSPIVVAQRPKQEAILRVAWFTL